MEAFAKHRLVCGQGRSRQAEVRPVRESCRTGCAGVDAGFRLKPHGNLQLRNNNFRRAIVFTKVHPAGSPDSLAPSDSQVIARLVVRSEKGTR